MLLNWNEPKLKRTSTEIYVKIEQYIYDNILQTQRVKKWSIILWMCVNVIYYAEYTPCRAAYKLKNYG